MIRKAKIFKSPLVTKLLPTNFTNIPRYSTNASHYDIIITGGGLVGTTLACTLGKHKFKSMYELKATTIF